MVTSKEKWFDFNNLTLGDIVTNKKSVMFCVDKSLINKELTVVDDTGYKSLRKLSEQIGIFDCETFFKEKLFSIDSPKKIEEAKKSQVDPELMKQINLLQFNMKTQHKKISFVEWIKVVFTQKSLDGPQCSQNQEKFLELVRHIRENLNNNKLNYTLFDFVEYQPSLLNYLIFSNIQIK